MNYLKLIIFFYFIIQGCYNKVLPQACPPHKTGEISLHIYIHSIQHYVAKATMDMQNTDSTVQWIQEIPFSKPDFENFMATLIPQYTDTSAFLSILYCQKFLKPNDTIVYETVKAVGIYSLKEKSYLYKLYVLVDSGFVEQKEMTTPTYIISSKAIDEIGSELIFPDTKTYSVLFLDKFYGYNYYKFTGKDMVIKKLKTIKK